MQHHWFHAQATRFGNACSRTCRFEICPCTQRTYIENVARFTRISGRWPADLGREEIRTHQVYLIRERHLRLLNPSSTPSSMVSSFPLQQNRGLGYSAIVTCVGNPWTLA